MSLLRPSADEDVSASSESFSPSRHLANSGSFFLVRTSRWCHLPRCPQLQSDRTQQTAVRLWTAQLQHIHFKQHHTPLSLSFHSEHTAKSCVGWRKARKTKSYLYDINVLNCRKLKWVCGWKNQAREFTLFIIVNLSWSTMCKWYEFKLTKVKLTEFLYKVQGDFSVQCFTDVFIILLYHRGLYFSLAMFLCVHITQPRCFCILQCFLCIYQFVERCTHVERNMWSVRQTLYLPLGLFSSFSSSSLSSGSSLLLPLSVFWLLHKNLHCHFLFHPLLRAPPALWGCSGLHWPGLCRSNRWQIGDLRQLLLPELWQPENQRRKHWMCKYNVLFHHVSNVLRYRGTKSNFNFLNTIKTNTLAHFHRGSLIDWTMARAAAVERYFHVVQHQLHVLSLPWTGSRLDQTSSGQT